MDSERVENFVTGMVMFLWFCAVILTPLALFMGWMPDWVYYVSTFVGGIFITLTILIVPAILIVGGAK